MKKEILSEINRMMEIMGQKNIIIEGSIPGEIISALIGSEKKIVNKANALFKTSFRKLDDLSNSQLRDVLEMQGFEQLQKLVFRKFNDKIGILPQEFAQKTGSELLDLASQNQVPSEFAVDWIIWYKKQNNVTHKGGTSPSGGSSLSPTVKPRPDAADEAGIERMIERFKKEHPREWQDFEDKIEILKPTPQVKKRMYADFKKYWDWSTRDLEDELQKITQSMTKNQMTGFKTVTNLLGLKNLTAKGTLSKAALISSIIIGYRLVKCTINYKECLGSVFTGISKFLSGNDSDSKSSTTPSITEPPKQAPCPPGVNC